MFKIRVRGGFRVRVGDSFRVRVRERVNFRLRVGWVLCITARSYSY